MTFDHVLITGSSGFLGTSIQHFLKRSRRQVSTLGRKGSTYSIDLAAKVPEIETSIDLVIHAAGKAHTVPKSEAEKQAFYDVNLLGTENLLQALSCHPPKHFVFISSVAVYGRENGDLISEKHPLEGTSPYADSKIQAERLVRMWGNKSGVPVLILRLPLIAGPNPPGNLGKMIAGIKKGRYPSIAGGKARRSVVLAEDVAGCIFNNFGKEGTYNLTDGHHPSFREIEQCIVDQLGRPLPPSIPPRIATLLGKIGDYIPGSPVDSATIEKMTNDLTFDDSKARKELNWQPRKVVEGFRIG